VLTLFQLPNYQLTQLPNPQTLELMTGTIERRGDLSLTKRVLYQLSTSACLISGADDRD